jgi:hypothetical protein
LFKQVFRKPLFGSPISKARSKPVNNSKSILGVEASVVEKLKALDEERSKLLDEAKTEALETTVPLVR